MKLWGDDSGDVTVVNENTSLPSSGETYFSAS